MLSSESCSTTVRCGSSTASSWSDALYRISTVAILSLTGPVNLSLHNYTVLANLLALPLIGGFGVVTAFNVTYLLLGVFTAYAMFLLGRKVAPDAPLESWLAGALFAWSPMLVTRGTQHFSLMAAAPLPLFMLLLLRLRERGRATDAAWLGACHCCETSRRPFD